MVWLCYSDFANEEKDSIAKDKQGKFMQEIVVVDLIFLAEPLTLDNSIEVKIIYAENLTLTLCWYGIRYKNMFHQNPSDSYKGLAFL